MTEKFNLEEEQKKLVLARFKTLNPETKILLGESKEYSVRDLMQHVEESDELGKKVIKVQMRMLQILASGVR